MDDCGPSFFILGHIVQREMEIEMSKDKAQDDCDKRTEEAQRASDHQNRMAKQESDARVREATEKAYSKK